jgi:hypothetical protein
LSVLSLNLDGGIVNDEEFCMGKTKTGAPTPCGGNPGFPHSLVVTEGVKITIRTPI